MQTDHYMAAMGSGARAPHRIQRKRTKGWRMPEGAVYVGRPGKWGNPFRQVGAAYYTLSRGEHGACILTTPEYAVSVYRRWVSGEFVTVYRHHIPVDHFGRERYTSEVRWLGDVEVPTAPTSDEIRTALAGRDLACWCPLDRPCHADVLLQIANRAVTP